MADYTIVLLFACYFETIINREPVNLNLNQTILDNYPRLSKTISGHFRKLSLVTI